MYLIIISIILLIITIINGYYVFKKPIDIEFLNEAELVPQYGFIFRTGQDLRIKINDQLFIVPKDFDSDLASVPRFLWSIFPPRYAKFIRPALLHDYLYGEKREYTRRYCDNVFFGALIAEDVHKKIAIIMFLGVRLFGWYAYSKKFFNKAV